MIRALPTLARVIRMAAPSHKLHAGRSVGTQCPTPDACETEPDTPCSCGWHLSSYELSQGVEVVECDWFEALSLS